MQGQDRSSRSASLGRCKTWTLDWIHELTDIWTPDKAINDDHDTYTMYPTMPLLCQCASRGFGDRVKLWLFVRIQYIKDSALSIPSILAIKPQVIMLMLIHVIPINSIARTLNFHCQVRSWILGLN